MIHLARHRACFKPLPAPRQAETARRQRKASAGRNLFTGAISKTLASAATALSACGTTADDSTEDALEVLWKYHSVDQSVDSV